MNTISQIFFRNVLKILTAVVIVCAFLYVLSPFIIAVLFGGIFAMAFSPFLSTVMTKKKWGRKKSLRAMILAFFTLGGLPLVIFCIRGSNLITEFFSKQKFSEISASLQKIVNTFLDKIAGSNGLDTSLVREKLLGAVDGFSGFFFKTFSDFLASIPDLVITALVIFLTFYFFLLKEEYIRSLFDRFFFFEKNHGNLFIKRLKTSCREVFFSNVVTGVLQSLIVAIGAFICNIGDFYIIFIITFIFSFIPIIGAAPMAFVLGIIAFIDSRAGAGITMCIIGAVSGVSDNLIRPYLASRGEIEVPGLLGFLAVIGGVLMLGLPGLFIGPLLASMMYGALPIIIEEYFPKIENNKLELDKKIIIEEYTNVGTNTEKN